MSIRLIPSTAVAILLALSACNKKDGGTDTDLELARQSESNLKQIGLAMHGFEIATNSLPRGIYGPDGKTLGLSWRVSLLPYLESEEYGTLYKQFKLDEPWDSEHNKRLIAQMPKVYAPPGRGSADGRTYYCAFEGKDALMQPVQGQGIPGTLPRGATFSRISDGISNTLMVVEAGEPVVWTKPDDIPFDKDKPVPRLGGLFPQLTNVVMCDGAVRFIKRDTPEAVLKALITPAGREQIPKEFFDK
jgi:hypothetical protein